MTLIFSSRLALAGVALTALLATSVHAQAPAPYYTAGDLVRSVHRFWYAPQAAAFATQATALTPVITQLCAAAPTASLTPAKDQWKATALAWDKLSGVQIGPLVQRRSARQIDFIPTRPELIKNAITTAPADARAMESIGTPAKGLPALEWLLWTQAATAPLPGTPACTYAIQVAADVQREAEALSKEFAALAARQPGEAEEGNVAALGELVNQWTGGLERLRWGEMEKPRLAGATGNPASASARHAAVFSRTTSGQTAARWQAQWQALRELGASPAAASAAPKTPGSGLASLESYMRGLGRDEPANKLAQSVAKADKAMRTLSPTNKAGVATIARSIADVKKVAENDVAPAMEVTIGFSDADGD